MSDIWMQYGGAKSECMECNEVVEGATYEVNIRFRHSGVKICLCDGCLIQLSLDWQKALQKFAEENRDKD